jgi:NADH dehydrogenase [ubiquinone] 1 alpha subcomplex assembly factor 2
MQWLRHTRFDPPSIAEQQQDLMRQERIKLLAAQADAKWAEKPSALDAPDKQQPVQPLQSKDPDSGLTQTNTTTATQTSIPTATQDAPASTPRKRITKEPKDSPWKQATQSQDWQPQGWSPAPAKRQS